MPQNLLAAPRPTALPIPWSSTKGILFDIDGTLVHSDDLHFRAFVDLLQTPEWEYNGGFSCQPAYFMHSPPFMLMPSNMIMFVFCNIRCVTCIRVQGQLPNMLCPSKIQHNCFGTGVCLFACNLMGCACAWLFIGNMFGFESTQSFSLRWSLQTIFGASRKNFACRRKAHRSRLL
jgi:hypothetical protein